jgi:hypothetical protein
MEASNRNGRAPQAVAMEGPVRCIFVRGGRAWTSGGKNTGWLQMWDSTRLQVGRGGRLWPCSAAGPAAYFASVKSRRRAPSSALSIDDTPANVRLATLR